MANELIVRQNTVLTFDEMTRAAKAMALSGYFNDARDVSQAMVKVMAGAEMGIGPFAAMSNIHVIKGKPVLGANLVATLIKNDHRYDYRIVELTDQRAVIDFYEHGEKVGTSTFTIEEARASGVGGATPPGKSKSMLEMYPKNMLFARALSNGAKWYTPGVFGGAPVYTPDELGADMDEEGDPIINVTPAPRKVDTATGEMTEGVIVEFDDIPSAANGKQARELPPADDAHKFYGGVLEATPWYGSADAVRETMAALGMPYPDTPAQARAAREQLVQHAQQEADKAAV